MPKLITPNDRVSELNEPLFFLGGPIRGAPKWQDEATAMLFSLNPDIIVANPRGTLDSRIKDYRISSKQQFPRQRAWEWYYQRIATDKMRKGSLIFWLPGEVEHKCEKAYGAMSRIELGQWMTIHKLDGPLRLSIGTDGTFSEWDTILYDVLEEYKLDIPIHDSLLRTCHHALKISGV